MLGWVAIPFSRDLPDPGIEPGSPTLQVDSLPSKPPGKPTFRKRTHKISYIFQVSTSIPNLTRMLDGVTTGHMASLHKSSIPCGNIPPAHSINAFDIYLDFFKNRRNKAL